MSFTVVPSLASHMSTSTASSPALNTPSSGLDSTAQKTSTEITSETRRDMETKSKASGTRESDRGMMPPPPLPVTAVHAPTPYVCLASTIGGEKADA